VIAHLLRNGGLEDDLLLSFHKKGLFENRSLLTMKDAELRQREMIEVERSVIDAHLRTRELFIRDYERYMNPPPDTAYSLEYAHYLLGNVRGKRILDFGCGAGENTVTLALRGADTVGIDVSPELIALAKSRCDLHDVNADLRIGSCHDTGFPDQSFDTVFAISILHHLDLEVSLREIARLLKPNGFCILQEPIRDSRFAKLARRMFPSTAPDISPFERPFETRELLGVGARIKMKLSDVRKFRLPHIPILGDHKWAWKVDRWLLAHLLVGHWASVMVWKATFDSPLR
jgi:2-polyprenyl-3-methyl-5-hydroxy-6-metoxy-1,4-benzoquinol methylase